MQQVGDLKQFDGPEIYKKQLGLELTNLGSPEHSTSKRERQSVSLLQTKRKVSTLESISQHQKRYQTPNSHISQIRQSLQSNSFQQSELSDEQFYDANSYIDIHGINFRNSSCDGDDYAKQKSKQEFCDIDQEKDNELYESQIDQSEGPTSSFYSIHDENSKDLQYEKTKMNFFNHVNINSKNHKSPNIQKSSVSSQINSVYLQKISVDEHNLNIDKSSGQIRTLTNDIEDNLKQQRKLTSDGNAHENKSEISQVNISQSNISKLQIIEESDSDAGSSTQSRNVSTLILNDTLRTDSDLKQYVNVAYNRSSCINQFNTKNISFQGTVDTLDNSLRLDQSFLKDEDRIADDGRFYTPMNKNHKKQRQQSDQNFDNKNSIKHMTQMVQKNKEKQLLKQQYDNDLFNKQINYYRQKNSDIQQIFAYNRILDIKKKYQTRNQKQKVMKKCTFNLTYIFNCEIQKSVLSLRQFQILQLYSVFLRFYFYFFGLYMVDVDKKYADYFIPMVILTRVFYIFSMFKVIFSYQNHTKSYRQVSQIFNSAFGSDDYFQIMNMNQLLTSDSFEKLSKKKIIQRLVFIFCPSEINILTLKIDSVSTKKRKDVWYLSNYIMISIEYMTVYFIMIFFSIYNSQFKKQFQLEQDFTLNIYTFSFIYFTASVILFLIFNLYYLYKGNIKLRKENRMSIAKYKKSYQ